MMDQENDHATLGKRKQFILRPKPTKGGESGIEFSESASMAGDGSMEQTSSSTYPICQCGRVMKTLEDIGGLDGMTNDAICKECAKVMCKSCGKLSGPDSRFDLFGVPYCKKCLKSLLLSLLVWVGICGSIALAIAFIWW